LIGIQQGDENPEIYKYLLEKPHIKSKLHELSNRNTITGSWLIFVSKITQHSTILIKDHPDIQYIIQNTYAKVFESIRPEQHPLGNF